LEAAIQREGGGVVGRESEGNTSMIEERAREFEELKKKIHDIRSFL
jgi:hypothetical protein